MTKNKKMDAYIARVTLTWPLDLDKPSAFKEAVDALQALKVHGATVEVTSASLGKIDATEK